MNNRGKNKEVVYNVKSSFKGNKKVRYEELKEKVNKKLLNVILDLEEHNKSSLN